MDKDKVIEYATQIPGTAGRPDWAASLYDFANELPENCRILEIGAMLGGSAVAMALTVKDRGGLVYSIDPGFLHKDYWTDEYKQDQILGNVERYLAYSVQYDVAGYVVPIPGLSKDILSKWDGRLFDMLLIDGEHAYEAVKIDVQWEQYLKPTATIVFDDWIEGVEEAAMEYLSPKKEWKEVLNVPRVFKRECIT